MLSFETTFSKLSLALPSVYTNYHITRKVFIQVKYSKFNLFWEMSVQGPPSQCAIASSQLDNGRAGSHALPVHRRFLSPGFCYLRLRFIP